MVSNIFYLPNSGNFPQCRRQVAHVTFHSWAWQPRFFQYFFHIKIWNCPIETSIYNMDPHQLPSSRIFPAAQRQERPEWRTVSLVTCCLSESKLANFFCDVDVEKIFLFVILVIWGVTSGPLLLAVHSPSLTWNLKMMVSNIGISFSKGWISGSMFNFRGDVSFIFLNTSICLFFVQLKGHSKNLTATSTDLVGRTPKHPPR